MKTHLVPSKFSNKIIGFTLVETAIAMGMVAIMISAFMVAFGPALKGIKKSISAKEASRMADALEHELSVVRAGETYATAFDKGFWWIMQSASDNNNPVLIYQYRGNPASVRTDGTLNPYTGSGTIPGVDYVIQTSVRRLNDTFHQSKIQAELAPRVLVGKVYYVKMTQLRYDANGDMVDTTSPNNITTLHPAHDNTATPSAYTDPVLPFRAKIYALPNVLFSWIDGTFSVGSPGTPVLTKNMAVSR